MKWSNHALFFLVGWLWGYLGSREINRCGNCSNNPWYHVVLLSVFAWPIHWWERKQIERKPGREHPL